MLERRSIAAAAEHEVRAVWNAATGPFGCVVKLCLLTAQRLDKVSQMKWSDVVDDAWVIDTAAREKGNAGELVLPELALSVVNAQPRFEGNAYVFASSRGERPTWASLQARRARLRCARAGKRRSCSPRGRSLKVFCTPVR
jgi:integrase